MAKFKPGQSGNLKGRPPGNRALADIIRTVGNSTNETGKTNKRQMAEMVWETVTKLQFNSQPISFNDWFDLIRWLGVHIDGPVPTQVGVENAGEVILRVVYENSQDNGSVEKPLSEMENFPKPIYPN